MNCNRIAIGSEHSSAGHSIAVSHKPLQAPHWSSNNMADLDPLYGSAADRKQLELLYSLQEQNV